MENITYLRSSAAGIADAPADGEAYVRCDAGWMRMPTADGAAPARAPRSGDYALPGGPVEAAPTGSLTLTAEPGESGTLRVTRGLRHVTFGAGLVWSGSSPAALSDSLTAAYGPSPNGRETRLYLLDEQEAAPVFEHGGIAGAWQDTAATTPADASGDPVRRVDDAYDAAVHLTSAGTADPTIAGDLSGIDFALDGERLVFAPDQLVTPNFCFCAGGHADSVTGHTIVTIGGADVFKARYGAGGWTIWVNGNIDLSGYHGGMAGTFDWAIWIDTFAGEVRAWSTTHGLTTHSFTAGPYTFAAGDRIQIGGEAADSGKTIDGQLKYVALWHTQVSATTRKTALAKAGMIS
jgi:hypothetical protein